MKVGDFYSECHVSPQEMEEKVREAGEPIALKYEWAMLTWRQAQERKKSILEKGQKSLQLQLFALSLAVGSAAIIGRLISDSIASSDLLWLIIWAGVLAGLSLITATIYGLRINRLGRADFLEPSLILQTTASPEDWKIKIISHVLYGVRRNAVRIKYAAFWIRLNQQFALVAIIAFLVIVVAAILPINAGNGVHTGRAPWIGVLGGIASYVFLHWRLIHKFKPYPDILEERVSNKDAEQIAPPDRP